MSEEASRAFLSVIAQVSATFVRFALVTPVFKFMGSGIFRKGEQAIRRRALLLRCLEVAFTPTIVLFLSLLSSLLLLSENLQLPETHHFAIFVAVVIAAVIGVWKMTRGSHIGVQGEWHLKIPFEWLPMAIMCVYLAFTVISLLGFATPSACWFYRMTLSLVIAGLLLLSRILMVRPDQVSFRPQDLQPEFKKRINELKTTIMEAVNRRQQRLRSLQEQQDSVRETNTRENRQQKSEVARQKAEIWRWQDGILEDISEWARKFDGEAINLGDCIDWLSWKEKWEEHLEEFKLGTVALENLIMQIGGESSLQSKTN